MPKIFERSTYRKPKMSAFDLSRDQKLSCQFGELVPTLVEEVMPSDHFKVKTEIMARLAPMLAPPMHRIDVYMHYWFVPNRIIWSSWEAFITGGREGTTTPTMPSVAFDTTILRTGKLANYMGIPPQTVSNANIKVSTLAFRAYQKIYTDFYRDPNLVAAIDVNTASNPTLLTLRQRAWEKDYLTSALPWLQRGPAVGVPVDFAYKDVSEWYDEFGTNANTGSPTLVPDGSPVKTVMSDPIDPVGLRVENLDENVSINIQELRKTSALQRWLEKMAVGGARYTEQLLSMFGKKSADSRLQRAEYLGGGKQPFVISEVLNMTGTTEAPQGDMAGHGISVGQTNEFEFEVPEHGWIIGILSFLPKPVYQQGIHRKFLRFDKLDYPWPEFANLGEQEVKNMEVYLDTNESFEINDATFGYQQRYAEFKYGQSTVHGEFRTTLDFWTMARIFSSRPVLNEAFVTTNPNADEMTRIFAVPSGDTIWCQLYHQVHARRPLPHFADPQLS